MTSAEAASAAYRRVRRMGWRTRRRCRLRIRSSVSGVSVARLLIDARSLAPLDEGELKVGQGAEDHDEDVGHRRGLAEIERVEAIEQVEHDRPRAGDRP